MGISEESPPAPARPRQLSVPWSDNFKHITHASSEGHGMIKPELPTVLTLKTPPTDFHSLPMHATSLTLASWHHFPNKIPAC